MSTFEFANEWVPTNSIDIPEIGNFYLEAIDEENLMYYYLMIKSSLGTASVMSYGPVVPDVQLLPDKYQVSFERLSFKEKKYVLAELFLILEHDKLLPDSFDGFEIARRILKY